MSDVYFDDEQMDIIRFCAEEVQRQRDDPHAVFWLVDAWRYAIEQNPALLTPGFILSLGYLAKPEINVNGFRRYPIRIGYETRDNEGTIPYQVNRLCDAVNRGDVDAQELYMEYENIHPFGDGNGRTGKILFNWKNGTLRNPVMPANPYGWVIP